MTTDNDKPGAQPDELTEKMEAADALPLSEEDAAALAEEAERIAAQEKAAARTMLPTCAEMRAKLLTPIPPRLLKKMDGRGGSKLTYIHWLTVLKFLDLWAPNWQGRVTSQLTTELGVSIAYEISIPCKDGVLIGSNVGFKEHRTGSANKPTGFGGAPIVAIRQAQKRAAAELGIGRGLYEKD